MGQWSAGAKLDVLYNHAVSDFYHFAKYALRVHPEGMSGPSVKIMRRGPEMRREPMKKAMVYDLDNTVNKPDTPPPILLYLERVYQGNRYLDGKKDAILERIGRMEREDDFAPHADAVAHYFRKGGLTKSLHRRACDYAAENLSIATGFTTSVSEHRDMAYTPCILSASPIDLIESLEGRLTIRAGDSQGTEFVFDSHGMFSGMEINLGESRIAKRNKILENVFGSSYGIEMMLDDNPFTGRKMIKSARNVFFSPFYVWLKDAEPMPGNLTISMQKIREDYRAHTDLTWRVERGFGAITVMSEEEYRKAANVANDAVYYGRAAMVSTGPEFEVNEKNFLGSTWEYIHMMRGLYPHEKTGILPELRNLEFAGHEKVAKIHIGKALAILLETSLEAKTPRDLSRAG